MKRMENKKEGKREGDEKQKEEAYEFTKVVNVITNESGDTQIKCQFYLLVDRHCGQLHVGQIFQGIGIEIKGLVLQLVFNC